MSLCMKSHNSVLCNGTLLEYCPFQYCLKIMLCKVSQCKVLTFVSKLLLNKSIEIILHQLPVKYNYVNL